MKCFNKKYNEDNSTLQKSVIEKLAKENVIIQKSDIFRLHRSGKPYSLNKFKEYRNKLKDTTDQPIDPQDKGLTAQVMIRFTNWDARSRVYNLHYNGSSTLSVRCDLSKYRTDLLQTARKYLQDNKLRGYCYNNSECQLILKNPDKAKGQFFTNFTEFKYQASMLTKDPKYHEKSHP